MNSNKHIIMSNIELERGKIITECISKRYTTKQASNLLNLSCRHTYRMKLIVRKYGISGLIHKSRKRWKSIPLLLIILEENLLIFLKTLKIYRHILNNKNTKHDISIWEKRWHFYLGLTIYIPYCIFKFYY